MEISSMVILRVKLSLHCVIFQLRMSTSWLSVTEKPSEMEEKLRLAKR